MARQWMGLVAGGGVLAGVLIIWAVQGRPAPAPAAERGKTRLAVLDFFAPEASWGATFAQQLAAVLNHQQYQVQLLGPPADYDLSPATLKETRRLVQLCRQKQAEWIVAGRLEQEGEVYWVYVSAVYPLDEERGIRNNVDASQERGEEPVAHVLGRLARTIVVDKLHWPADVTPPTVEWMEPAELKGQQQPAFRLEWEGEEMPLRFLARDNQGLKEVRIYQAQGEAPPQLVRTERPPEVAASELEVRAKVPVPLRAEDKTVVIIEAEDRACNPPVRVQIEVRQAVDRVPPRMVLLEPAGELRQEGDKPPVYRIAIPERQRQLELRGLAWDDRGIAEVDLSSRWAALISKVSRAARRGEIVRAGLEGEKGKAVYFSAKLGIPRGERRSRLSVEVRATDTAGKTATLQVEVCRDREPPQAMLLSPRPISPADLARTATIEVDPTLSTLTLRGLAWDDVGIAGISSAVKVETRPWEGKLPREVPPGSAALEFSLQVELPREEPLILEVEDRLGGKFQGQIRVRAEAPPPIKWKDGMEMVRVPAGTFIMGTSEQLRPKLESPEHEVYLDEYYIDVHEVTVGQFKRFLNKAHWWSRTAWDPSPFKDDRLPVVNVTWEEARAYARFYGKRLPTEAEWEKAARGTQGWKYPWGYEFDPEAANYNTQRRLVIEDWAKFLMPVGSFPKGESPYGCLDMAGNVWEWCADWYDENYYQSSPARNPSGPRRGTKRVIRGGSWGDAAFYLTTTTRRGLEPQRTSPMVGFRCCVSAKDLPRDVLRSLQRRR